MARRVVDLDVNTKRILDYFRAMPSLHITQRQLRIMPWCARAARQSARVPDTVTNENYFYPLFNTILGEAFPEEEFSICPQYPVMPITLGREGSINYAVTYLVQGIDRDDNPLFFIEVKPPGQLLYPSAREAAAVQIRDRFRDLAVSLRIPKLYGVSAFGRRIAYFSFNAETGKVEPPIVRNVTGNIEDVAPMHQWDTNIMEEDGRDKFLRVVAEVKEMACSLRV
jgi:hypothetical protein